MKILIDIDELEKKGVVTPQQASSFRAQAVRDTGSTAINILLAFGVIAIAIGLMTFVSSDVFSSILGAIFIWLGWFIINRYPSQWSKLASIWMIIGGIVFAGSMIGVINHPSISLIISALILIVVGIIAESKLLIALAPLSLLSAVGGSTGYWHACYSIYLDEPSVSIILFSTLAYLAWRYAKTQTGLFQNLAIVFARMSIILVNFGFWVGSLWGDTPTKIWHGPVGAESPNRIIQEVPEMVFIIGWAFALLLAGAWGAKNGRRFVVNTVAVFGAIHFYTQWFERIGFHSGSLIIAGIVTVIFGLGLWRYNKKVI